MKRLTFGLAGLVVLLRAGAAHATSYTITTNTMTIAADGACSLVEAIAAKHPDREERVLRRHRGR